MTEAAAVERAVVGLATRAETDAWVSQALDVAIGSPVAEVLFRSGRIDAVYGLATATGERVLLKVHRAPVDLDGRRLVVRVQQVLAAAGFPCATPLVGPLPVDGRVVSVETLLPEGERADGHDSAVRGAVAVGLTRQVELLSAHPELVAAVGRPPAWCDYTAGAWGSTHDAVFDFSVTPPEYAWLQRYAAAAADVLMTDEPRAQVAAHADWYCGNLRFDGSRLVAAFDWDLFSDSEPVVAGITAGMYSAGTSAVGTPPTPEDSAGFLADYETARGIRFDTGERRIAEAAARWSMAYTARCDVTQIAGGEPTPGSALDLLATRREEYADLGW